jgi:Carboxypeptidase regulatory-like domain/TonB-dependent Receptor Plug Domain
MIARPIQRSRLVISLFLCLASTGRGQLNTATVLGVVQDSTRSSIPDAKLKLINTQTGSENDTTTNTEGSFLLPAVIPGAYTLQIERVGFATTQLTGLLLSVGDTRNLLIRMRVGSVAESVTVDASGLTLNTTDGSVSTVVDRRFVTNVPLNGRSFQDLISMTPGIVTQSPQAAGQGSGTQGDFSVNGQQPQSNSFFVDGVSANVNSGLSSGNSRLVGTGSVGGTTALGTTQSLVSVDALQEFRVLSSTYSAEYGRTPGGQFTFLTRSGSSKLHGTLYDYYRHDSLDAADWFQGWHGFGVYPAANYNQNDFGATLGTPLIFSRYHKGDDKTFVFFSYEGLYLDQPTPQTYIYAPNDLVTQQAPPALIPLWGSFPSGYDLPTDTAGLVGTAFPNYALPAHVNSTSVRLDHTFSPRLSFFFRYADTPSYSQTRQLQSVTADQVNLHTFTFGSAFQLSANRSNDFRLGYSGNDSTAGTQIETLYGSNVYTNLNGALGIGGFAGPEGAQAYIHLDGIGDSESYRGQYRAHFNNWNVRDNFSLQARNHLFKLGIDQRRIVSTENPPPLSVQADFFDLQSMLTNSASYVVVTRANQASPHLNEFSAFVQDEWRLSNSLTLSLGLRWEVNPPPYGSRGAEPYAVRGDIQSPATLQVDPRGAPLWHTSWFNLAPRFGAAWLVDPQPGKELIVRAGGGIFYDTGNQPALRAFEGLGFKQSVHYRNVPLPATPAQINFSPSLTPPYSNSESFVFPQHLQLPYSLQWNIGIEKALGKNQTATISYVGANGHRLLQEQRRNVSALNPMFGDVSYFPTGLTSNYEALQAKFQRSLGHGVEGLASYTFAHTFDYGSTDPAFPFTYSSSGLDVRHNVEAALSWDLPKPSENHLVRKLVGNWQVNGRVLARTGFPVTPEGNFFFDPITGNPYYSGANLIPGEPLYLHGAEYPGHRGFNGGMAMIDPAFTLPSGTAQGNAPRNLLRGFGAAQMNIAARREFALHDNLHMQIEGATFNIFNHPNFGYIDPYLTDALFGQATKLLNQSFGNTGALYQQGGPRSAQFSIKLVF